MGSSSDKHVDVRIICATNRNPQEEVRAGRFREDLFYRLHVIPIQLPPLRDRGSDILTLAEHFLQTFSDEEHKAFEGFDPDVESWLRNYAFPGNVRELQNLIRNIVVLNDASFVSLDMLPALQSLDIPSSPSLTQAVISTPSVPSDPLAQSPRASGEIKPLWRYEKEIVEEAIALCDGNIAKAASALEIAPSTIYRKRASWEENEKLA